MYYMKQFDNIDMTRSSFFTSLEERVPQIIGPSPPPRDTQQSYTSSAGERSSPLQPASSHSPSRECVKPSGESQMTSPRKNIGNPVPESMTVDGLTTNEAGDNVGSQRTEKKV